MTADNETLFIASVGSGYVLVKLGFMAFKKWSGRDKRYRLEGQYDGTSKGKRVFSRLLMGR